MTDKDGRLLPTSFIPFCSYQSNILGVLQPEMPFTSCSLAQPTVLDGQLCYYFNVSSFAKKVTKMGKSNGLLMLIDHGPPTKNKEEKYVELEWSRESAKVGQSKNYKNSVRVFVQTHSRFSTFKSGSFAISSPKRMVGTQGFMEFPDDIKKCQVEALEECHVNNFFRNVKEECSCVPWGLERLGTVDSGVSPQVSEVRLLAHTPGALLHSWGGAVRVRGIRRDR